VSVLAPAMTKKGHRHRASSTRLRFGASPGSSPKSATVRKFCPIAALIAHLPGKPARQRRKFEGDWRSPPCWHKPRVAPTSPHCRRHEEHSRTSSPSDRPDAPTLPDRYRIATVRRPRGARTRGPSGGPSGPFLCWHRSLRRAGCRWVPGVFWFLRVGFGAKTRKTREGHPEAKPWARMPAVGFRCVGPHHRAHLENVGQDVVLGDLDPALIAGKGEGEGGHGGRAPDQPLICSARQLRDTIGR